MKKNFMTLAFMLVFASTTIFADGEIGHGTRAVEPTPTPTVETTSNRSASANTSNTLFDQIVNAIYALVA
jgi:hypothetical protein